MEKLTVMNSFVKSVESLRNTECSRKEKVQHFHQISECLASPSMLSNDNYGKHVSSAISVLLFFCEDLDSVVRMSAEENLVRIIRFVENTRLSRILLDLYNEIKKNGNQKSLRICLNFFGYYCPRMKEKNVKWYALKLMPCLQTIAKRKETLLIENLSEFIKCFSQHLQICLNDNEAMKLIEAFLTGIVSDCAVKRRCSAQNCIYLIQGAHNVEFVARMSLSKALEYIVGQYSTDTVVGVLGFLRLLLPIIIQFSDCENKQIIEIYDLCLHLLNNCSHSIINASLEVINAILNGLSPELKELFVNHGIHENDFLKKRKSLKNQIFQLKNAEMTCSASASVSSTMASLKIQDKDKGSGEYALGKSSTETIKDAFKSGKRSSKHGNEFDEQFASNETGRDADQIKLQNAGQDPVLSSSTNEIKINDESTTVEVASTSNPSKCCRVVVDNVDDDSSSNSTTSANANKMTSTSATHSLAALSTSLSAVPQIHEPPEEGHLHSIEDKSQMLSDVDNESFNSIDFESEITIGIGSDGFDYDLRKEKNDERKKGKEKDEEKAEVKSTKSTDSIGAFFNNLLSHSNTETMTKLFRPSTKLSATTTTDHGSSSPLSSSSASRAKGKQSIDTEGIEYKLQTGMKYTTATAMPTTLAASGGSDGAGMATLTFEDDTISLESINSHISLSSHVSQQSRNEQDLVLASGNNSEIERKSSGRAVWYEVVETTLVDHESKELSKENRANEISMTTTPTIGDSPQNDERRNNIVQDASLQSPRRVELSDGGSLNVFDDSSKVQIKLKIGSIYEQNIIYYTARLIASRFLLKGTPGGLIPDGVVRVSIKSLSLAVLAVCVELKPEVLNQPLEIDRSEVLSTDISFDASNENSSGSTSTHDFFIEQQTEVVSELPVLDIGAGENLLEIKDDHFGECTNPYLFDSSLSKSADQILLTQLGNACKDKGKAFDNSKIRDDRSRLNNQLEKVLSKSEIIESKSCARPVQHPLHSELADFVRVVPVSFESHANQNIKANAKESAGLHLMDNKKCRQDDKRTNKTSLSSITVDSVTLGYALPAAPIQLRSHQTESHYHHEKQHNQDGERQFIHDVFLYCHHSDPLLRGNMQIIVYNFTKACLLDLPYSGLNGAANMMQSEQNENQSLLHGPFDIGKLLKILIKGFRDEIHTVIIQALSSFAKIYPLLMLNYFVGLKLLPEDDSQENENYINGEIELDNIRITPKLLLNHLRLCFSNKYWLVQNKYADVISTLDFDSIRKYCDDDIGASYEDIFLQQLIQLLGDDDVRVRDHVAICLCDYINKKKSPLSMDEMNVHEFNQRLLDEFLVQRVFRGMSESACDAWSKKRLTNEHSCSLLSRVLFLLTNNLLILDKKNMQFGIINAIRALLNEFNAIDHMHIWNEFNLADICLCFMQQNFTTAMDIHMQISLIEINTKLLSANLLTGNNVEPPLLVDNLFEHVIRILSIYYYLFSNQKPPMLSTKPQKADLLFANIKDSTVHHAEDFSNDYFYMKLYGVLRIAYDNYKISINQESGNTLMSLIATCLNTLSTLLEFKHNMNVPNSSVKLIQDILQYLTVIVNYLPIETINCLRQLLKFLFCRNYGNRKVEYENFLKLYFAVRNCGQYEHHLHTEVDKIASNDILRLDSKRVECRDGDEYESGMREQQGGDVGKSGADRKDFVGSRDRFNLSELFASAISFPLGKSKLEEDCARHIKLFEPLVIYCLTLFMKSNAVVQACILDLLSDLLDFNVTYSILDSKNIIFEQVESSVLIIESGMVRNSNVLIRSIIRFLLKLTKQSDKKFISIPKIISITNNLLANNAIRESSIIALKELAFEIFFKHPQRTGRAGNMSPNIQESNAEREVVLRMLEQFISSVECQKMLAILLLWARHDRTKIMTSDVSIVAPVCDSDPATAPASASSGSFAEQLSTIVQEKTILSIFIGALQNDGIVVNNCETYFVLDTVFRNCDKSILLRSDLFETMLGLFMRKHVENFNNLSHVVIILDNVILKTEQIYLANHVKLLFMKNNIQLDSTNRVVGAGKGELNIASGEERKRRRQEHDKTFGSRLTGDLGAGSGGGASLSNVFDDEINYFVKVLYAMLETCFSTVIARPDETDYSYLTSKYIRLLAEVTIKFEKMRGPLRSLLAYNNTISEKLETCSQSPEQHLEVDILTLLCELCLGLDEGSSSSSSSCSLSNSLSYGLTLQPRSILQYTQKIKKMNGRKAILSRVCEKFKDINWWMTEDIKVLLSMELLPAFIETETKLKQELAEHPVHCRVLMDQLIAFPISFCKRAQQLYAKINRQMHHRIVKDTLHISIALSDRDENIIPSILQLISKININASFLKLKFLWGIFIHESSMINRSAQKLVQLHLDNEVQSLKSRLQRSDWKVHCSRNNEAIDILKEIFNRSNGAHLNKLPLSTWNTLRRLLRLFTNEGRLDDDDTTSSMESSYESLNDAKVSAFQEEINEKWLMQQVVNISSHADCRALAKVLMDFKSEIKLKTIFNAENFSSKNILGPCLDISFHTMITSFQNNCVQYNPHINYMNVNPLLRVSLQTFLRSLECVIEKNDNGVDFELLAVPTLSLMTNLQKLESISLFYIKLPAIEKFIREQLLKSQVSFEKSVIEYGARLANHLKGLFNAENSKKNDIRIRIQLFLQCLDSILQEKFVWLELNQPGKYERHLNAILDMLHLGMTCSIRNTIFYRRYWLQKYEEQRRCDSGAEKTSGAHGNIELQRGFENDGNENSSSPGDNDKQTLRIRKAIFLAKLIEASTDEREAKIYVKFIYSRQLMKYLKSISISLLRTNYYYGLAVVPYELFRTFSYDKQLCSYDKLPSIPVDHLSDVDILQRFIKRLSIFGFSTRQQFEEYFMTFLLLINRVYDVNMVDEQEQFLIKNICLTAIIELLLMCRTFPAIGNQLSKFDHSTRWPRIKCRNNISLKKLHKIQLIIPGSSVFYHPNLERDLFAICHDSIIGTNYFFPNQYELNHVWQQMESLSNEGQDISNVGGAGGDGGNIGLGVIDEIKEDTSGIDLKSSCQLIFDVFTQIIEQNHVLVLPNLVKFCEICDNREHIRWIKNTVMKLQEQIPFDDTISHQYIIYLLCRTQSILVLSFSELSHLCSIISTYLKSTHIFIRNATLHGLLCLLECCTKTSTSLGKLSEELCLLREIIVGYTTRYGIIEESPTPFSDMHSKLVWTLNFSLIEMTTKFVPECNLLSNTIISANNLLKRTSNETIYLCIIHGLERIMVVNTAQKPICDKVEKLALDLVKVDNELFSLPALKLLLSCVYMGSSKQLETTEHSNGIVQDDPEIIAQQTEKVDVLLHRIKSSTSGAARIYGEVLCQIVRDLVPPNEILTKVIKEFLAINQPHCEVIARIVYQVFRSCIDSSFLRMLQDWLICSLPNFLTLPPENGVWCLTVIFLSSSINLDLIKLFPFALNDVNAFGEIKTLLFIISARDFYSKLNAEQKTRFLDIFKNCESNIFMDMLKCL